MGNARQLPPGNTGDDGARRPNLELRIPEQAPPPADSFLLDPKESKAWIESLPIANVGETARLLFSSLGEFNRMEIPELLRARIVEQFRQPTEYVVERMRRHFVDQGFPLSSKSRKAANLALEFQSELATSYKIIIRQILEGRSSRFDRKLLAIALHRAMFYLSKVLFHAALTYAPWPPNVWREIHSIYAYASQNRIHMAPVKDPLHQEKAATSIEQLYKSTILFASSSPQRLRQSQMCTLMNYLPKWTHDTTLRPSEKQERPMGNFHVDLWTDEAPVHDRFKAPQTSLRGRIMDIRPLVKKLTDTFNEQAALAEDGAYGDQGEASRALLRCLLKSWTQGPVRRPVRTKLNFELQVVSGLNRIHQCMVPPREKPEALPTIQHEDPYIMPSSFSSTSADMWLGSGSAQLSLSPSAGSVGDDSLFQDSTSLLTQQEPVVDENTPDWLNTEPREEESRTWQVQTVSESANGYCVQWQGKRLPPVKIGELLGVQSAADVCQFGLGVIRWLSQPTEGPLELGIEMFSPSCLRAQILPNEKQAKPAGGQRCLLVPSSSEKGNFSDILLESGNLSIGSCIDINLHGDTTHTLKITELVEATGAFKRFACHRLKTAKDQTGGGNAKAENTFEDLWSSL